MCVAQSGMCANGLKNASGNPWVLRVKEEGDISLLLADLTSTLVLPFISECLCLLGLRPAAGSTETTGFI